MPSSSCARVPWLVALVGLGCASQVVDFPARDAANKEVDGLVRDTSADVPRPDAIETAAAETKDSDDSADLGDANTPDLSTADFASDPALARLPGPSRYVQFTCCVSATNECSTQIEGGPTSCKTIDAWKMYVYDLCKQKLMDLTDYILVEACDTSVADAASGTKTPP